MKKRFSVLLPALALALALCFSVGVCAEESIDRDTLAQETADAETAHDTAEALPDEGTPDPPAQNVFTALYDFFLSHSAQFFSLLSALCAALIALCYKKGLLPLIKTGLGAIVNQGEHNDEKTSVIIEKADEMIGNVKDHLQISESSAEEMRLAAEQVRKIGEDFSSDRERTDLLIALIGGQIDLLADIFLSSSLPVYEKERIGERVAVLKALGGGEAREK